MEDRRSPKFRKNNAGMMPGSRKDHSASESRDDARVDPLALICSRCSRRAHSAGGDGSNRDAIMNLIVRCRHTRANYQGPDLGSFAGNRGLSICHQPRRLRRRLNPRRVRYRSRGTENRMRVRVGKRESRALSELTSLILSEAHESRLDEILLSPPPSPPVHVVTGNARTVGGVPQRRSAFQDAPRTMRVYARVHLEERTSERALSPKQQRAARIRIKRFANKGAVTITNLSTCGTRTRRKLVPVPGEREKNR